MAMLAERKRREKWCVNPRGKAWTDDNSKFGQRLMEKMGWKAGQGLGAKNQGPTDIVKVRMKDDNKGLGFKENGEEWLKTTSEFNELLDQLGSSMEESGVELDGGSTSLEDRSKKSKSRVHYHKFTRGKDLSRYSHKDLASIIGPEVLKIKSETDYASNHVIRGSSEDYFKSKVKHECDNKYVKNTIDKMVAVSDHTHKKIKQNKDIELNKSLQESNEGCITSTEHSKDNEIKKKKNKKNKHILEGTQPDLDQSSDEKHNKININYGGSNACNKSKKHEVVSGENEMSKDTDIITTKLKKKKKSAVTESCNEQLDKDGSVECSDVVKKKKKKKKKNKQDIDEIQLAQSELPIDCSEHLNLKTLEPQDLPNNSKISKKRKKIQDEVVIDHNSTNNIIDIKILNESKTKKRKHITENMETTQFETPRSSNEDFKPALELQDVSVNSKKSKKRKRDREEEVMESNSANKTIKGENGGKPSKKKNKKYQEENLSFSQPEKDTEQEPTIDIEQGCDSESKLANTTLETSTKISELPKVYMDPTIHDVKKPKHAVDYEYRLLSAKLTQLMIVAPAERLLLPKTCDQSSQATIRKLKRMHKCMQMRTLLPSRDLEEIDIAVKTFIKDLQPRVDMINALVSMEETIGAVAKTIKECGEKSESSRVKKGDTPVSGLSSDQVKSLNNLSARLKELENQLKEKNSSELEPPIGVKAKCHAVGKHVGEDSHVEHQQHSLQFRVEDKIKLLSEQIQSILNGKIPDLILQSTNNKINPNSNKTINATPFSLNKRSQHSKPRPRDKVQVQLTFNQKQQNISKTKTPMHAGKKDMKDVGETTDVNILQNKVRMLEEELKRMKNQRFGETPKRGEMLGRGGINTSLPSTGGGGSHVYFSPNGGQMSAQKKDSTIGGQLGAHSFTSFVGRGRGRGRGGSRTRNRIAQTNFEAKQYADKCKALNKLPNIDFNGVNLTMITGYASTISEDVIKTTKVSVHTTVPEEKINANSNVTSNKSGSETKIFNKSCKDQNHLSFVEEKKSSVFVSVVKEEIES